MTTATPDPAKAALRREIRARRRERATVTAPEAREQAAEALARELADHLASLPGGPPRCVAVFESLPTEPPTHALIARLLASGVEVLVPAMLPDRDLDWIALGPEDRRGEPLGVDAIGRAGLVVSPAVAVDEAGRRLGQGGGSYDRALPRRAPGTPVVAVVFDDELLHGPLPVEDHDQRVDAVLTPTRGWTDLPSPSPR